MKNNQPNVLSRILLLFSVMALFIASVSSASAARLPIVGNDSNSWGTILNDYLLTSHTKNGTLKAFTLYNDSSFAVEGNIADEFVTNVKFTNTTANRTITFPDASGNVTISGFGVVDISGNRLIIDSPGPTFSGASSRQTVQADAIFSSFTGGYGAGVMGNAVSGTIGAGNSIIGGIIGKYNLADSDPSDHPQGAVIGEIGEDVGTTTLPDGAFIAVLGGDTAEVDAGAAYTVRYLNSISGSKFNYGLDLFSAAIDSYQSVTYNTADLRLSQGATFFNNDTSNLIITENNIVLVGNVDLGTGTLIIAEGALVDSKIVSADIKDNTINDSDIVDDSLTKLSLAPDSVEASELADNSVASANIILNTIVADDIATDAVGTAEILDGTIADVDTNGALTGAALAADTLIAGDIATGAVTTTEILDGTILNADVSGSAAIDVSKLSGVLSLTGTNTLTAITASPILIRPSSAPVASTKLFDVQTTGTTTTLFSVDSEGDVIANSLDLSTVLADSEVSDTLTASNLVAGSSVVSDAEVDDTITVLNYLLLAGGTLTGGSPLVFEGATDNTEETTFTITDPTADRTITFPDTSGTIAYIGNPLSQFAATTSAQLAGVISDESGSGALVFATSPTLVTPVLGVATGTSLATSAQNIFTATAATAPLIIRSATATDDDLRFLPQAGGAGRFAGIFTSADLTADRTYTFGDASGTIYTTASSSITSAQLLASTSDETGTGLLVFGTAPTFASTMIVGTASGTTGAINLKGTTSGTITLTVNDIAGTNTITLPATTGTVVTTGDSGSVTSAMIAADTIVADDIATNAVGTTEILDNTIDDIDIADNSLDATSLATDSVAADEIAASAVGASEITDGTITTTDISGTAGITDGQVSDTLTASDLVASGSVVSDSEVNNDITLTSTNAGSFTFAGTENLAITSDLAGAVNTLSIIGTPSATAATTGGLFIQQADSANTNGVDSGILINNADTNLALTNAIEITNTGGGGYTNFLDTPSIDISGTGAISGSTSINKVAITAPTTSATLTIADGKTLTASNTLTFTGTDSSSVAFGAGGTVAYVANKLSVFAATTSAELAGVISDETGSGALVFANTPTLVTPALGAATATSIAIGASGTPITKHLSGTATNLVSASIANVACGAYGTITVTGAAVGNTVYASPDSDSSASGIEDSNLIWNAYVSATNTVTIRACNPTGVAIDAGDDQEWRADVWQH